MSDSEDTEYMHSVSVHAYQVEGGWMTVVELCNKLTPEERLMAARCLAHAATSFRDNLTAGTN